MKQRNTTRASKKREQIKIKRVINLKNNRRRGNLYEVLIAKELRDLGFTGIVTSRSESKNMDDNKVDLIDTKKQFPLFVQLKRTVATPQFFKICSESTVDWKKFVLIWNKQERKGVNMCSSGELVMMSKDLFYELIKQYVPKDEK